MDKNTNIDFADLLIVFLKWKKTIISLVFISMVIAYLGIYYFVEEKFDASAMIIPSEESSGGIAGLIGGLSNLPIDIPGMTQSSVEVGMFNTIISSRTMKDELIEKYDLFKVFKLDSLSYPDYKRKARERLGDDITTEETDDGAYIISVRMPSPKLSADIANYVIKRLNDKLIDLKVRKSKDNRIFLGERLAEVRLNLSRSEDSLAIFQRENKLYAAKEQVKTILESYAQFETELLTKELQLSVAEKVYGKKSRNVEGLQIEVKQLSERLNEIKKDGVNNSPIVGLDELPEKALNYFRYFREIEINQTMLKFMLPMYEQARIDEQKDVPILQVIDYADAPVKKSYPPRTLFTVLIGIGNFLLIFAIILFMENENLKNSEKFTYIRKNLFKWTVD
ncbi:MAG: GumC family protein [Rhodothermaceae bacterium]